MELALKCAKKGNLNAISDSMSGFAMSRAALTAAGYNVRININSLEDKSAGDKMLNETEGVGNESRQTRKRNPPVMKERGGI